MEYKEAQCKYFKIAPICYTLSPVMAAAEVGNIFVNWAAVLLKRHIQDNQNGGFWSITNCRTVTMSTSLP